MASPLPPLARAELERRLSAVSPAVAPATLDALLAHYRELRRWAARVSLIGPGSVSQVVERHYAESLAGAELIAGRRLLDLGSGAGFPGLILAAARPALEVTLVERRQRKAVFLRAAARSMGLRAEVVEGDLRTSLPQAQRQAVDSVTLRAVRLDEQEWRVVLDHAHPETVFVLWQGLEAPPGLPAELRAERSIEIPGRQSRIVSYRRQP